MNRAKLVLAAACAASILAVSPVAAQDAPGGTASAPAEGLRYFAGDWRVSSRDPRTGETEAMRYRVEPVLDGTWFAGAGSSDKPGFQARDMWGRDQATGDIIRVIFDGSGAFVVMRSPGWKGDTLVLEGDSSHLKGNTPLRQTITRLGPREFRAVWESKREGVWTAYADERVTRPTAA